MKNVLKKLLCVSLVFILSLNTCMLVNAANMDMVVEKEDVIREHTFIITSEGELIEIQSSNSSATYASEERIVLGSYTLTKSQTKTLANNIRTINNSANAVAEFLLGCIGGIPGASLALCLGLARNATFNSDVIYAADHNKRIRITITDAKNYHTSYSTQITYAVVN